MSRLTHTETAEYVEARRSMKPLRPIACGGAGEGKSTLIGRLLDPAEPRRREWIAAEIPDNEQHLRRPLSDAWRANAIVLVLDAGSQDAAEQIAAHLRSAGILRPC